MKATGIVRRVDDLGRVVLPKELRSTMHIKVGDPLEVFVDRDAIILKKYTEETLKDQIDSFFHMLADELGGEQREVLADMAAKLRDIVS